MIQKNFFENSRLVEIEIINRTEYNFVRWKKWNKPLTKLHSVLLIISISTNLAFSNYFLVSFRPLPQRSVKNNYWLISNIFRYFHNSNLPYVSVIFQTRIICTKISFIFNVIFPKIFMEFMKNILHWFDRTSFALLDELTPEKI